jgi:hypothetical protein
MVDSWKVFPTPRCPDCDSTEIALRAAVTSGYVIDFAVQMPANTRKVYATCRRCHHHWRMRNIHNRIFSRVAE